MCLGVHVGLCVHVYVCMFVHVCVYVYLCAHMFVRVCVCDHGMNMLLTIQTLSENSDCLSWVGKEDFFFHYPFALFELLVFVQMLFFKKRKK